MGQRRGFSTTDLAKLQKLYGCDDLEVCRDDYADLCPIYSISGGCEKYGDFMGRHCEKTCGLCKKDYGALRGCRDKDSRFDRTYFSIKGVTKPPCGYIADAPYGNRSALEESAS